MYLNNLWKVLWSASSSRWICSPCETKYVHDFKSFYSCFFFFLRIGLFDRYRLVGEWSFIRLAVFFACCASSARSSNKPVRVAVACPGASPPVAAWPGTPAGPVTFLVNSRSRICKNIFQFFTHRGRLSLDVGICLTSPLSILPLFLILSPLKFWQPRPSYRLVHMQIHFPSSRVRVPPLWHGLHLHKLYSAT